MEWPNGWRLSSGELTEDAIRQLETYTALADELRAMCVVLMSEVMRLADLCGATEIADAAQKSGLLMSDAALPRVVVKTAGRA
jgi:hypothetical protein